MWACVCGCARVCASVRECASVCVGVGRSAWVCTGVCGYAQERECLWDEFSEFLLENRVSTSADFNMYPIRIFLFTYIINQLQHHLVLLFREFSLDNKYSELNKLGCISFIHTSSSKFTFWFPKCVYII